MNYFLTALKKYAVFSGRARRSEYWYFTLFYMLIYIPAAYVGAALELPMLALMVSLVFLLPSISVGVRRMHDVNKSGWFILIPIYNLILACTPGTVGENNYGEDPKGGSLYGADDYEKPADLNPEV